MNARLPKVKPFSQVMGIISAVILVIGLLVTFFAWRYSQNTVTKTAEDQFNAEVDQIELTVARRIDSYNRVLYSLQGLFAASQSVARDEWSPFTTTAKIAASPDIRYVSYIEVISDKDKQSFIEGFRNDKSTNPAGYPDIKIYPETVRDKYAVVKYIDPEDSEGTRTLGFDYYTNTSRKASLDKAADTNQPVASELVDFISNGSLGFIVVAPIYENGKPITSIEERRSAIVGFVTLAIESKDLFTDAFLSDSNSRTVFTIFDSGQVIYKNGEVRESPGAYSQTRALEMGGRTWTLQVDGEPSFNNLFLQRALPIVVGGGGVTLSVLLFLLIYFSGRSAGRLIRLQSTALKAAANSIVITDLNGIIQSVNPAFTKLTGYEEREAVGQSTRILNSGKQTKEFYSRLWSVILAGETWNGELINKRKDGTLYYEEQTIAPVKDRKGKIINFIAIKQDITARKESERTLGQAKDELANKVAELQKMNKLMVDRELKMRELKKWITELESEERAMDRSISDQDNSILNLLPVGVGIVDMQGHLLYYNNAMLVPGGYSRDEMKKIGNVANLYFDPENREKELAIAKSQGYVNSYKVDFKRKDGTPYSTLLFLRMIRYQEAPAWIMIAEDITKKKTREESEEKSTDDIERSKLAMMNLLEDLDAKKSQLERERKRDEALLVSIGDGVVVTDEMGKITFVNKAFEDLIGWKLPEVVGKMMVEVVLKYDEKDQLISQENRSVTKVLEGKVKRGSLSTVNLSHYYKKRDGSKMPILGVVTPIIVNEIIIGAVQVFRDITGEKEVDKMKDNFVAVASHELRTPLTAIDGLVSMILDGEFGQVGENLNQPLQDISTSSERLIRLVNDLLNLSRIQAGRLKYNLTEISILGLVTEVADLLRVMFEKKGLYLNITSQIDAQVYADRDKLEQVLNNLIGNSYKFTDNGGVSLNIEESQDNVVVSVADTGIGIRKEDQEKLFGKFQQVDTTFNRHEGTGLGLHISRQMVQKMGGDLVLESSEPGKGSKFSFSLAKAGSQKAQKIKEDVESEGRMHPDQKSDTIKV